MQSLWRILFLIGLVLMLLVVWVTAAFQTQPDIDPLFITATYLVAEATGTAINTLTPTPTFSPEEIVHEAVTYKQQLVDQMGFSSPIFDDIAGDYVTCLIKMGYRPDLFQPQIETTIFNGSKYVILNARMLTDYITFYDRLFFFRVDDGIPVLLDSSAYYFHEPRQPLIDIPEGFADRNSNGAPDLPVTTGDRCNCCLPRLDIFEIGVNGDFINIAPVPTDIIYPARLVDINEDRIYGLRERIGPYADFCCSLTRWWGWNGTAYVDSSAQRFDFYMPRIKAFFNDLDQSDECPIADYRFKQILFDYYAMGKLAQAHRDIVSHFKVNNCSVEQLKTYHNLFFRFNLWLQWSKPDGSF